MDRKHTYKKYRNCCVILCYEPKKKNNVPDKIIIILIIFEIKVELLDQGITAHFPVMCHDADVRHDVTAFTWIIAHPHER